MLGHRSKILDMLLCRMFDYSPVDERGRAKAWELSWTNSDFKLGDILFLIT
jgi:hypothetical protein